MARIVIIGTGLTGLSAAYHLEQRGFFDYEIFDQTDTPGGLCRSITQDGFTFDYTGHLLHISDPYIRELIQQLIGFDQFNTIERRSYIYSHNTYTHYPFQVHLKGLPSSVIAECIAGFIKRKKLTREPRSFIEWVNAQFGAGFGKHFFFPYQQKIFATHVRSIAASWTGRFVPSTTLEQIIDGIVHDKTDEKIGYNAQFFYPKRDGISLLGNSIARVLSQPLRMNYRVTKIDTTKQVVKFENGHEEPYNHLINTMPLDHFLSLIREKSSMNVKSAQSKLRCNSVINFNLGINKPAISEKHWIYFPENQYPFYRLGFPHNFTSAATPPDCSSLYGEFAHIGKSQEWQTQTAKTAIAATMKLLKFSKQDIATQLIIPIQHAYVIFDRWRDKNLEGLLTQLREHQLHSIGRYGAWKYASMQEALLDGKQIAEQLTVMPARRLHMPKQKIKQKPLTGHTTP